MRILLLALGALLSLAFLVAGAVLTVDSIGRLSDVRLEETRTRVPGTRDAELDAGKHVLYYEVAGDVGFVPRLEVTIRRDGDGPPLRLRDYGGTLDITGGGRAATALRTVRVPEKGTYRIRARGQVAGEADPAVVLGRPLGRRLLRLGFGIVLAVLGFALATLVTVLAVVLAVRDGRSADRQRAD